MTAEPGRSRSFHAGLGSASLRLRMRMRSIIPLLGEDLALVGMNNRDWPVVTLCCDSFLASCRS